MKRKVLIAMLSILVIAGLAVAIPLSISENLEKYNGPQKIAAKAVLDNLHFRGKYRSYDNEFPYYFTYQRVQVNDVILVCSDKYKQIAGYESDPCREPIDPKKPYSYIIQFTRYSYFGAIHDQGYMPAGRALNK